MADWDDDWNVPVRVKRVRRTEFPYPPPNRGLAAYGYNNLIIGICTVVFFLELIFPNKMVDYFALWPSKVIYMPWQLVTAIFLHGGFDHYLVNMIVLFFFGAELERRVGGRKYLEIFFVSGIVGNLGYIAFCYATHSFNPALGASGAIYGVMAALAIIAPEIRVLLFFFIPISIRAALVLFILYNLVSMLYMPFGGIAYSAHLAGIFAGLYYGHKIGRRPYFWFSF